MSIAEKLQTIAENEQRVYDRGWGKGNMAGISEGFEDGRKFGYDEGYGKGYEAGKAEGGGGGGGSYEQGVADGKQAEYDAFWDNYQDFGKRTNYTRAFQGVGWTDSTFRPKYDMAPTIGDGAAMFFGSRISDLASRLNECGVVIDTSEMINFSNMFQACSATTTIPPLDFVKATIATNLFYNCSVLKSIILNNVPEVCTFSGAFYRCADLENITITGTIGQDLDLQWSTKLSKESILSIMWALSETSSGKTITLSKSAVDAAFYDPVSGFIGSDTLEWGQRVIDRPNWTVTLV